MPLDASLWAVLQFAVTPLALWVASAEARMRLDLNEAQSIAAGLCVLGGLGMAMFWITFFDTWWAIAFKVACGGELVWLGISRGRRWNREIRDLVAPCALMFVGLLFLLAAFVFSDVGEFAFDDSGMLRAIAQAWTYNLPFDNEIPFQFAQQLRQAELLKPMMPGWLSSDRPPLQTGLYLLFDVLPGMPVLSYQAAATSFQALVIPAAWGLTISLGGSRRRALFAALLTAFAPFAVINMVFVWPKFVAAAMLCAAATIYLGAGRPRHESSDGPRPMVLFGIGGAAVGLAMLAHGATAFVVISFGLVVLFTRRFGGWKGAAVAAVTALVLYAPWTAYQKFYDPPGDRLMKWHLAGVEDLDDRSLSEALSDSYANLDAKSWFGGRMANTERAFALPLSFTIESKPGATSADTFARLRYAGFFEITSGLGVLFLALYALPFGLLFSNLRPLTLVVGSGTLTWIVLLYSPGATLPHQGSYFLWPALAALLCAVPMRARLAGALIGILMVLQIAIGGVLHAFA